MNSPFYHTPSVVLRINWQKSCGVTESCEWTDENKQGHPSERAGSLRKDNGGMVFNVMQPYIQEFSVLLLFFIIVW